MVEIQQAEGYVTLRVRVQPKASRTACAGEYDGALKIALTAPPVDGAANKELCSFIAKSLHTAKSNVWIVSGDTGRNKIVAIKNVIFADICAEFGI